MKTATRISPQSLTQLPRPGRNPAYRAWIRKQPCCVTGQNWSVECCHTGPRGLSQRANDLDCIPLIRRLHTIDKKQALDRIDREEFEEIHGVSILKTILYLQAKALSEGIDLTPMPYKSKFRKGLGRAGQVKRDVVEGAA